MSEYELKLKKDCPVNYLKEVSESLWQIYKTMKASHVLLTFILSLLNMEMNLLYLGFFRLELLTWTIPDNNLFLKIKHPKRWPKKVEERKFSQ